MKIDVLVKISLRNLLRQKRRSILLGIAICFGTMILVVANSFSRGVSDVLFNDIIAYVFGHVNIAFTNGGNYERALFYNGDFVKETVHRHVPELKEMDEAIGVFCRVIGNGKSDNLMLIGINASDTISEEARNQLQTNFRLLEGSFGDLNRSDIENPVILSTEKAKALNVKRNDIIRIRFMDMNGQNQACRATVIGIFKPSNMFMQSPMFFEVSRAKSLLGYAPHQIASLILTIRDPQINAKKVADTLHKVLKPRLAIIPSRVHSNNAPQMHDCRVVGYRTDSASLAAIRGMLRLTSALDGVTTIGKENRLIGARLAEQLSLAVGDSCTVSFKSIVTTQEIVRKIRIDGIVENTTDAQTAADLLLINEKEFYPLFYRNWPVSSAKASDTTLSGSVNGLDSVLAPEWILLNRYKTTKDAQKMYREIRNKKNKATTIAVASMYETASDVLKVEQVLNLITFSTVLILFFIILIGVVNSLRMAIRERSREIGTIRAIGMQRSDVRNTFLLETSFLALFASIAGVGLAFLVMWGLSQIPFTGQDNPMGMLLVNNRIKFTPAADAIVFFVFFIVGIAMATAYFPARAAANKSAVEALRHYE